MTAAPDLDSLTDSIAAMMAADLGDALAPVYDEMYPDTEDLEEVGQFLQTLAAPPASVLEVGVGTGRIALRLARNGFRVTGVDNSAGMLARLREKDPDGTVTVVESELATLPPAGFDLVLAPFNVMLCALTQADQIAMLKSMAEQTAPGGHVVVETFDPSEFHVQLDGRSTAIPLLGGGVVTEVRTAIPSVQYLSVVTTVVRPTEPPLTASLLLRYVWPAELDLLAGIAGLEPVGHHPGWNRTAFVGGHSRTPVVSVYRRPS